MLKTVTKESAVTGTSASGIFFFGVDHSGQFTGLYISNIGSDNTDSSRKAKWVSECLNKYADFTSLLISIINMSHFIILNLFYLGPGSLMLLFSYLCSIFTRTFPFEFSNFLKNQWCCEFPDQYVIINVTEYLWTIPSSTSSTFRVQFLFSLVYKHSLCDRTESVPCTAVKMMLQILVLAALLFKGKWDWQERGVFMLFIYFLYISIYIFLELL